MNDKEREKFIKQLNSNQHFLFKEKDTHWAWIQHLDKVNKNQTMFDNQISSTLQDHSSKLGAVVELVKEVKELRLAVQTLKTHSHSHEAKEETP